MQLRVDCVPVRPRTIGAQHESIKQQVRQHKVYIKQERNTNFEESAVDDSCTSPDANFISF